MSDDSQQDHIKTLREAHQRTARQAAETGVTPKAFAGDPAFQELLALHRRTLSEVAMRVLGDPRVGVTIKESAE